MTTTTINKEMSVYDLAIIMMAGFDRVDHRIDTLSLSMDKMAAQMGTMATKEDLERVKTELRKEFKKDIGDINKRLDNMRLYIPSVI